MSEENNLTNDILDDAGSNGGKLPTMLNVLTILTFIGAGLGVLAGLLLIVGGGSFMANIPLPGASGAGGSIIMVGAILLVLNGACIFGAIQMRKLKKMGFYIYAAAQVAGIVFGIATGGFQVMAVVWPVLFVALYGSQLKELK